MTSSSFSEDICGSREAAAECLFERDADSPSLPEAILRCVQKVSPHLVDSYTRNSTSWNAVTVCTSATSCIQVPIDLRRSFLRNLLLTGGISRMKGLLARLKSELLDLCHGKFGQLTAGDIAFYRFGDDISSELYLSWLGGTWGKPASASYTMPLGSMFGSLDCISNRSFTREEWLEHKSVPDWTNKIDDYPIPPNASLKKP